MDAYQTYLDGIGAETHSGNDLDAAQCHTVHCQLKLQGYIDQAVSLTSCIQREADKVRLAITRLGAANRSAQHYADYISALISMASWYVEFLFTEKSRTTCATACEGGMPDSMSDLRALFASWLVSTGSAPAITSVTSPCKEGAQTSVNSRHFLDSSVTTGPIACGRQLACDAAMQL